MVAVTLDDLARLFLRERLRFGQVVTDAFEARLEIRPRPRSAGARDFGYEMGGRIVLYREIMRLPRHNVVAIIRHELAHVCDPVEDDCGAEGARRRDRGGGGRGPDQV
jgi:hypothetical protein